MEKYLKQKHFAFTRQNIQNFKNSDFKVAHH